jgi:hypothetical protein
MKYFVFTFTIIELCFDSHILVLSQTVPFPVDARSKAWDCGRSLAGIAVQILQRAWMSAFVSVVCCTVEDSATGQSLVQRISTECCVSNRVWSRNLNSKEAWLTRAAEP